MYDFEIFFEHMLQDHIFVYLLDIFYVSFKECFMTVQISVFNTQIIPFFTFKCSEDDF